jgi:hypothetical protein
MVELSRRPPLSISRENRIDRSPRRHSHQKMPALAAEAKVSTRSTPGFATVPIAPRPLLSRINEEDDRPEERDARLKEGASLLAVLTDR